MRKITRKLLEERNKIYGDYKGGCQVRITVMNAIKERYLKVHSQPMPAQYKEFFYDIINKLARLAPAPYHIDSWRDIAGYAELIADSLDKEEEDAD